MKDGRTPSGDPRDLDAVQAVLGGRPEAFERIVRNYQNLVASVAYRMGVPRRDIEDLVSEVFVKIYRNLGSYRPEFSLSTWIYRISTNHMLDYLRKHRHEREQTELSPSLRDPSPSPQDRLARIQRAERVREALREVPEKYRLPIALMHIEGKRVEEISQILSLPTGTVKTRLARGRARLADILKKRFPDLMALEGNGP
jgi:RNA polymerase sigma-70 factor (ECF subfamily)